MGFTLYPAVGNGTVTSVSSSNDALTVTSPTTTPVLTVNLDDPVVIGEMFDAFPDAEAISSADSVLVLQDDLVLTGAGTAAVNATYDYRGDSNGYPYYNQYGEASDPAAADAISVFDTGSGLRAVVGGTSELYVSNLTIDNYADIFDALQDLITDNGANPVPTVTSTPTVKKSAADEDLAGQLTTTATAAGTTTLTVDSNGIQVFTGVTTQTVVLPVVSTLPNLGYSYEVINNSTGAVTVNSSGSNLVQLMAAGSRAIFTCVLLTGTSAASWTVTYTPAVSTTIVDSDTNPVAGNAVFDGLALKAALAGSDAQVFSVSQLEVANTDTTLTRASAGNVAVEGNLIYRAGGTDVPVADGGTGASTAAAARTNLLAGTFYGSVTFAGLPVGPTQGDTAVITDSSSSALAWGDGIAAGGGSGKYFIWFDGTSWSVMGTVAP